MSLGFANRALIKPVSGGGYVAQYQAVYDAFTIKPSELVAAAQNTMVEGMVSTGVWAKKDVFYVLAAHTNNNGEALINWINPGTFDAILVNNPAFVAFEGFTGDGATSYINTVWNATNDAINYKLNDASISVYIRNNVVGVRGVYGAGSSVLFYPNLNGTLYTRLNRAIHISTTATTSLGLWVNSREAINNFKTYKDKAIIINSVLGVLGFPNNNLLLLALNTSGSPSSFGTQQIAMNSFGGGFNQQNVNDETDYFEAYMDSNGKGVIT